MANILIVDDERSYCESIAQQLADEGHKTTFATAAVEAIELAKECRPDLLLIEWNMRDAQGGLSIAEKIRQGNPALRIILMTGFPHKNSEQDLALASNVDRVITKPFTLEEVSQAVSQSLARPGRDQRD